jgi:hypothetical protein
VLSPFLNQPPVHLVVEVFFLRRWISPFRCFLANLRVCLLALPMARSRGFAGRDPLPARGLPCPCCALCPVPRPLAAAGVGTARAIAAQCSRSALGRELAAPRDARRLYAGTSARWCVPPCLPWGAKAATHAEHWPCHHPAWRILSQPCPHTRYVQAGPQPIAAHCRPCHHTRRIKRPACSSQHAAAGANAALPAGGPGRRLVAAVQKRREKPRTTALARDHHNTIPFTCLPAGALPQQQAQLGAQAPAATPGR